MRRHPLALILSVFASCAAAEGVVTDHFQWKDLLAMGISGWEISADTPDRFISVTDRGWFIEGRILREDDNIVAVEVDAVQPILDHEGQPAAARRVRDWADAEGLALLDDGSLVVGFERWMHVGQFQTTGSVREVLVGPRTFQDYSENRQLEAVAVHPDGRIFAWPERPRMGDQFETFVYDDGTWSNADTIPETDGYSIVGADFASDGTLYLLERRLILARWWQNRLRQVDQLEFQDARVIWTGDRNAFYNLEGVAVIEGAPRRLLLVGDNNNQKDRPTDIVEITLTD